MSNRNLRRKLERTLKQGKKHKGFIYVYSYPTYQKLYNWYKIGLTTRTGAIRVKEQTSGMPEKPIIYQTYTVYYNDASELKALEKAIHDRFKLMDKWLRDAVGNEWFISDLDEIANICEEEIAKTSLPTIEKKYIDYVPQKSQIEGTPKLKKGFKIHNKLQAICATGTGKTILMYSLVRGTNKTVLFLCPTIALVKQSYDAWTQFETINALAVCSDNEAIDGVLSTTNAADIEAFLCSTMKTRLNVVFGTYDSAAKIAMAQANINSEFDFAFFDEAHKTVTHKNGRNYQCVREDVIKAKKRLFVTASKKVCDLDSSGNVATMSDYSDYGPVGYELTTKEAIQKGYLCPFEVFLFEVEDGDLLELTDEIVTNATIAYSDQLMKSRHLVSLVAVLEAIKNGRKKIATYHNTNESARKFARLINSLKGKNIIPNDLLVRALTGKEKMRFRLAWLEGRFATEESAIVTSASWMREGVDIPCLDTVVIVDPIKSGISAQQTVGRGLRIDKNNPDKDCWVIVPKLMNVANNSDADDTLLAVVSEMAQTDEDLEFGFNVVSPRTRGSWGGGGGPGDDIPEHRLVELAEYRTNLKLRALGLYDQVKREEMLKKTEVAFQQFSF
jgi:superfamily II DNA or RNA helicase